MGQHSLELFPVAPTLPSGFSYHENFLSEDEEQIVLAAIMNFDLHPMIFQGFEAKRKVASFGFDYSFDHKKLTAGNPIPSEFHWVIDRASKFLSLPENAIAELLITEYPVGAVINWHRDAPPFNIIAGISLAADCVFKLRPHDKVNQSRKATVSLPVARRSLYVMSGVSRDAWQHCTAPVQDVRFSITLRTLKKSPSGRTN